MSLKPALICAVLLAGASTAFAECSGRTLYEDAFDDDLTGWVMMPENEAVADGKFVQTPIPGNRFLSLLPSFQFDEEDLCIEVAVTASGDITHDAGIAFWAEDYNTYYFLILGKNKDGQTEYGVFLQSPDEFLYYILEHPDNVAFGPEAANRLMLTINGSVVAAWLNGEQIGRARIQPPYQAFQIGLYSQMGKDGGTVSFDDFRVTRPKK